MTGSPKQTRWALQIRAGLISTLDSSAIRIAQSTRRPGEGAEILAAYRQVFARQTDASEWITARDTSLSVTFQNWSTAEQRQVLTAEHGGWRLPRWA